MALRRKARAAWALVAAAMLAPFAADTTAGQAPRGAPGIHDIERFASQTRWRVYAIEYARSEGVRERRLVRGAPASARVDMSWCFFVAVGHGRVVLVDVGTDAFTRPGRSALRARWSIARATTVTEALAYVGLAPDAVTDIVLTHHHWDHVGALGLFGGARVHALRSEWRRVPPGLRRTVERDGRFEAIAHAPAVLFEGLAVRETGRHTAHSLVVEIDCADRTVALASDAAYLRRNLLERLPITQTVDADENVADVRELVARLGAENVVPGHDPGVFARGARGATAIDGVAAICP